MEQNSIIDKQFNEELASIMKKNQLINFPDSLEYTADPLPDIERWLKHE